MTTLRPVNLRLVIIYFLFGILCIVSISCSTPDYIVQNNLLLSRGEVDQVIADYQSRTVKEPGNADLRYYLSQAYVEKNDLSMARREIDQALILDPLVAKYRLLAGKISYGEQTYFEAINHLSTALTLDPQLIEIYYYLALSLHQVGKTAEALGHLGTALQIEPLYFNTRLAWDKLSFNQIQQNATGESSASQESTTNALSQIISHTEETSRLKPNSIEAVLLLSDMYRYLGQVVKSRSILERWLRANPNNDQAQLALARLYYESGDFKTAAEKLADVKTPSIDADLLSLRIALKTNQSDSTVNDALSLTARYPESDEANLLTGRAYLTAGNLKEAERYLLAASRLNPDYAEVYYYLALTYREQNDPYGAEQAMERVVKNAPNEPGIKILYLGFLIEEERWYEAEEYVKTAYLPPDQYEVLFLKGVLAKKRGNYAEAEEYFKNTLRDRFSIEVEVQLAENDILRKKFVLAENRLTKLRELDRGNAAVHTALAKLYLATHRIEEIPPLLTPFADSPFARGETQLILGDALGRLERMDECLSVLEKAYGTWRSNVELIQAYTFYLGLAGQYDKAIQILESMSSFPVAYERLFSSRLREYYYLAGKKDIFKTYSPPRYTHDEDIE